MTSKTSLKEEIPTHFTEGCAWEASSLLTCLAADDYSPEKCADLFYRFKRCALEQRITEFGLVRNETISLPSRSELE